MVDVVDEVLKGGGGIGATTGHDHVLVVTKAGAEGGLPLFPLNHAHQFVSASKGSLQDPFSHEESHQSFLNQRERVPIFPCNPIDLSVVHA